ncbi:MAG: hypothetical protein MJZ04_00255 [Bacteroidales bacterium]|nr:hypothetical protein [Bacteroidales bacterium]
MEKQKRQYRELSDETKQRISNSLKGTKHDASWRYATSQSLKKYWATVPYKNPKNTDQDGTTIQDIMLQ